MGIDYTAIVVNCILLGVCASVFYKAAEMEHKSPWLWTLLSLSIYFLTFFVLHWGWLGCLLGQAGLYVAITLIRTLLDLKSKP